MLTRDVCHIAKWQVFTEREKSCQGLGPVSLVFLKTTGQQQKKISAERDECTCAKKKNVVAAILVVVAKTNCKKQATNWMAGGRDY